MAKPMAFILQPDDETEETKKAETFTELFDKGSNPIETATILVNFKQFNKEKIYGINKKRLLY